jgi:hypothetical protein
MNKEVEFEETARIHKNMGATEIIGGGGEEEEQVEDNDADDDSSSDEYELQPLSVEIVEMLGPGWKEVYENDEDLVESGIGDMRVILVGGKPYELVPSSEHNMFTGNYANDFCYSFGRWGACCATFKIHLSNGFSQDPDLGYWGYPRCNAKCTAPLRMDSIPDVVIQFCWKNPFGYEESALDDIMTKGLERLGGPLSATRPRVGYLIKVRFSRRRKRDGASQGRNTQALEGLDIYRLVHGTTTADAHDPMNHDAKFMQYTPGGEDVLIVIKPEDLGITGRFEAWWCGSYAIKASEVFDVVAQGPSSQGPGVTEAGPAQPPAACR